MALKNIDAKTLKEWLDSGEAIVVDVREPEESAAESIPGAKFLPLATVSKSALPNHTNKKLVIHCRGGKRGGIACEALLAEDSGLEVYNLDGGISAWSAAGYPVNSSGAADAPNFCMTKK